MFQKVADVFVRKGSKAYGILSVLAQAFMMLSIYLP
jgi:16S rRNA A1518/A1519 N6-dimethyltransferase RsmA/KsgA/DIM1 with predicted DNA glycosylase/AP lyase activity